MKKEEVSRVAPAMSTGPVFTLVIGYFFLAERFITIKYAGVLLIVIGAIVLSFKENHHHFQFDKVFLVALFSAAVYAIRHSLVKYITMQVPVWSVFLWMGIGSGTVAMILLIFHHPHIRQKASQGVWHFMINGALTSIALYLFSLAISEGPVSLVMAIAGTQPMLVFLSAAILSKFWPRILHEKMTRKTMIQKTLAIMLIIMGAVLVL